MRIWKFDISKGSPVMPKGSKILSLQMQDNKPTIWALCDPVAARETRKLIHCSTGSDCSGDLDKFLGTYQTNGGLVYHVFEK